MFAKHNRSALNAYDQLQGEEQSAQIDVSQIAVKSYIPRTGDEVHIDFELKKRMDAANSRIETDVVDMEEGKELLRVAAAAISDVIIIVKAMKEKAVNAAHERNAEEDRVTLQDEFSQLMSAVAYVASRAGYNGRLLLNGNYGSPVFSQGGRFGTGVKLSNGGKVLVIRNDTENAYQEIRLFLESVHPIAIGLNKYAINTRERALCTVDGVQEIIKNIQAMAAHIRSYRLWIRKCEDSNIIALDEDANYSWTVTDEDEVTDLKEGELDENDPSWEMQFIRAQGNKGLDKVLPYLR